MSFDYSIGKMFDRFNSKSMLISEYGQVILPEYAIVKGEIAESVVVKYRDERMLVNHIVAVADRNFQCAYVFRNRTSDVEEEYRIYVAAHGGGDKVNYYATIGAFEGNHVIYACGGTHFYYNVDGVLDNEYDDDL